MAVPLLRTSRFFRALVLTTGVFSFLLWLYTTLRVLVNGINPPEPFFPGVRSVSFLTVGVLSFGVSFMSMLVYLWLWGRFRGMPLAPPSPPWQQP
jgi:hypothetical protein